MFGAMLRGFFGILRFHKSLQISETALPEDSVLLQPRIHRPQWLGIELVKTMPPFAPFLHQVGAPQQSQMFGDRRP